MAESRSDELGDVKRIGEVLVANGWIEPSILARALAKQRETGLRLCSLLVINGVLDPDEASRALGEQHGVAAVLQKHIARRDESLSSLLPAALARACVALPIGRMGSGDVIVCVRDPSPALHAQLARAMNESILLAVAPAHQLEALVIDVYGPEDVNEFDVDLSTGPIASLDLDDMDQIESAGSGSMAGLGSLELVDLDDTGVDKDASQSQSFQVHQQRTPTLPPTTERAQPQPAMGRVPTAPVVDAPTHRTTPAALAPHATTTQRTTLPPVNVSRANTPLPGRSALDAGGGDLGGSDLDDPVEITVPRTQTSPRAAPGRAALDAAGPAIARTNTPPRALDDAAGIAIARTTTPTGRPGPGRSALDAAGPAIARTQTPSRALGAAAAIAVARTQTPSRVAVEAPPPADASWDLLDLAPSSRAEPGPSRATASSRATLPARESSAAAISLAADDAALELPTPTPSKRAWPTTSPKTTLGTALSPREPARPAPALPPREPAPAAIATDGDDPAIELAPPSQRGALPPREPAPAELSSDSDDPLMDLASPARRAALPPRESTAGSPAPRSALPPRESKWPASAPKTTLGTALPPREPAAPTPPSGVPTVSPAAEPPRAAKPAWPTSAPKTTLGTALTPREPAAPTPPSGVPIDATPSGVPTVVPAEDPPRAAKPAWPTSAPKTTLGTALPPREPAAPTPPSGVPTSPPAADPPRTSKPAWPTSAPKTTLGTALRPREPGAPTPPTGVPTTVTATATPSASASGPASRESTPARESAPLTPTAARESATASASPASRAPVPARESASTSGSPTPTPTPAPTPTPRESVTASASPASRAPLPARESASTSGSATPTPAPTPAARPAPPARPITPPIGIPSIVPPRTPGDPARTPPAARAALDRAAAAAAQRTGTPPPMPPRDPKVPIPTPPSRPSPMPVASAASRPPAIAVGTETQGAPIPDAANEPAAMAVGTRVSANQSVSSHLREALDALAVARNEDIAFDAIMKFSATRWSAALLLGLDDAAASGRRGHGSQLSDDLAQWIVMSLHEPSLIQIAHTTKGVVTALPGTTGEVEGRLQRLLGMPSAAAAIEIAVNDRPTYVIAVGDPNGDDTRTAATDLERVATALGSAVARLRAT